MGLSLHVFCLEVLGCWMGPGGEDFYHGAQKDPLFRHSGQVESGTIDWRPGVLCGTVML